MAHIQRGANHFAAGVEPFTTALAAARSSVPLPSLIEQANAHKTPCRFLADIAHSKGKTICMPSISEPHTIPKPTIENETRSDDELAPTYYVVCWNDPVNFMEYVTHVFMKIFGWQRQKAAKHMLEVHAKGKSVLIREGTEKAEFYVHQLQGYKLQATMEPAE